METWMSWAVFLVVAGAAYWYYTQSSQTITRGRSATRTSITSSLKDTVQWDESEKKTKAAPKAAKAKAPRKSVKSAVQEVGSKVEATLSAAGSTAGADADDDLSPVAASNKAPSGRDVSDMLGSQAVAPAVMSIKPSEKQNKATKPQISKTDSSQETKKQRQNRKKNEEAKAAREEEEKQRQALLEKQRRTAREARGEPAKNGQAHAAAPASNPWTTVPSARGGAVQAPPAALTNQFLDTFEGSDAPTNGTAETATSSISMPTEEEQVKAAMEETAWETVAKGGKPKRKTLNEELLEENNNVGAVKESQPIKAARPTPVATSENKKPSSRYQILSEQFTSSHADDSDWPVV